MPQQRNNPQRKRNNNNNMRQQPAARSAQPPRRRRNNRRRRPMQMDNPMYQLGSGATRTIPNSNQEFNVTGTDSIFIAASVAPTPRLVGETVAVIPINGMAGRSLADATERWQNVRYKQLEIFVDGPGTAVTEGQYIISFVADGYEIPTSIGEDAIRFARSQHCNQSSNYRGKLSLKIPFSSLQGITNGWYKTDENPDAPRNSSPGSVVITNILTPSASVGIEVQMRWVIDVRDRTSGRSRMQQVALAQRTFGVSASDTADTAYQETLVYNSTTLLLPEDFVPSLAPNVFYTIPGVQLSMVGNTGTTGSPQAAIVTHIGSSDGNGVELYRYNPSTSNFDKITVAKFTAKPASVAAPIWESQTRFPVDPRSPAFKLGF